MHAETTQPHFSLYQSPKSLIKSNTGIANMSSAKKERQSNEASSVTTADSDARLYDTHLRSIADNKDRAAFIEVFEFFAPRVKSFLMRGGLNADIADELAQDTMLNVWEKSAGFDASKASASTWIYTIARNKKIDYMRKNFKPTPDKNDPMIKSEPLTAPDEAVEDTDRANVIEEAMETIPEEQRVLVEKSFFEDKTHQEISDETGIPLGTVKSRIRLAMERLRHKISGEDVL